MEISHDEWTYPTAPPSFSLTRSLSLSLSKRNTGAASRINPRSSGKYFQHPLFKEIKKNVGHRENRERKKERKRDRDRVRARVSQSKKEYRLVYCARPSVGINALQSAYDADYSEIF